jgi:phosphoribosylformylglycinamidine synthase subunit PurS
VGRVVVDVMLKPEILDPQGQAVAGALPRLGFDGFTDVRQGKRFELEVPGAVTPEVLDQVRQAAATLLSNPVIEDVVSVREARPDGTQGTEGSEGTGGTEGTEGTEGIA